VLAGSADGALGTAGLYVLAGSIVGAPAPAALYVLAGSADGALAPALYVLAGSVVGGLATAALYAAEESTTSAATEFAPVTGMYVGAGALALARLVVPAGSAVGKRFVPAGSIKYAIAPSS
jgi:hypothetical protein